MTVFIFNRATKDKFRYKFDSYVLPTIDSIYPTQKGLVTSNITTPTLRCESNTFLIQVCEAYI